MSTTTATPPPPPILPTTTTATPPITTTPTALRSFLTSLNSQLTAGLSHRRPWTELLDRTAFSKPDSISDAATRLRKNYSYFRVNYLTVISTVVAVSLITNPFSLLTLALLLAAWCFLYLFKPSDEPLIILGRSFSDMETLGMLVVASVFVVFLTNVGSVLMSAVVVGAGLVCAHGVFRVPEDLFLDDQGGGGGGVPSGFLTFLGANAAVSSNV